MKNNKKTSPRINPSEISFGRLRTALNNRISEIPHMLSWSHSKFSQENKKRIEKYQNCYSGKRCFIVANGPSLQNTNLELLENEITIGLNRIYLRFQIDSFRPTYLVAMNELVLEQFSKDILNLHMPKFVNWNKRTLFPQTDENILYLKNRYVMQDRFSSDITKPIVVGGTVTFAALQLAYYMGFNEVILVGLDHTFLEKGIPNIVETRTQAVDKSHFHPDYFPKGTKWQLPDLQRSEIDYRLARKAYEDAGREIIDATIGGHCTVFTKGSFEEMVQSKTK